MTTDCFVALHPKSTAMVMVGLQKMTTGSLMKVERIAECSLWRILQYF